MKKQDDLAVCRSVHYTRGPRKGSVKCSQCGFFFVPDEQQYPLREQIIGVETYITGIEWFKRFKCCPNCETPNYRRCLGQRKYDTWHRNRGCNTWFIIPSRMDKKSRRQMCKDCNPYYKLSQQRRNELIEIGRQFVSTHGRAPTCNEMKQMKYYPSHTSIRRLFGSVTAYQCALMQEPRGNKPINQRGALRKYTDAEIITKLQHAARDYGRALSENEWDNEYKPPYATSIMNRFGLWSNAWRAAGIDPIPPNGYGVSAERMREIRKLSPTYNDSPTSRQSWQQRREAESKQLDRITQLAQEAEDAEQRWREHQFKRKS